MTSSSSLILIAGKTPVCFVQYMARSRRFISSIIFFFIPVEPSPNLPSGYQTIPFLQQSFHILRRDSRHIPFEGVSQGAQRVAEIQRILEITLFQVTVEQPGEEGVPAPELVDHFEFKPPSGIHLVSLQPKAPPATALQAVHLPVGQADNGATELVPVSGEQLLVVPLVTEHLLGHRTGGQRGLRTR